MENGSFQAPFSEISNFDFQEEKSLPPVPAVAPTTPLARPHGSALTNLAATPKSSSVEALISQNEDLAARLKVSLRRLSVVENENEALRIIEHEFKTENSSLSDQLLIWKEKETYWQQKNLKLETQMEALRSRFPELEQMEEKIERYQKYHEKIKTQVKPYIHQLKSFAQNLTSEVRRLTLEIEAKDASVRTMEGQLRDWEQIAQSEILHLTEEMSRQAENFAQEQARLTLQLAEKEEQIQQLTTKSLRLNASLLKIDELENTLIALHHAKDKSEATLQQNQEVARQEIHQIRKDHLEMRLELEDLRKKEMLRSEELKKQTERNLQLEEQLVSLRFIWKSKSDESNELSLRLESLEKLNQELSHRLNRARKGEASL